MIALLLMFLLPADIVVPISKKHPEYGGCIAYIVKDNGGGTHTVNVKCSRLEDYEFLVDMFVTIENKYLELR